MGAGAHYHARKKYFVPIARAITLNIDNSGSAPTSRNIVVPLGVLSLLCIASRASKLSHTGTIRQHIKFFDSGVEKFQQFLRLSF